jgi:alpha-1,6-mannosyltransferase
VIECQDAYNLPWAALAHRKRHPGTALVAGYMTDFPNVYVERPFSKASASALGRAPRPALLRYCGRLYRQFDAVYALSEHGGGNTAALARGRGRQILPLGVELADFGPDRRDPELRRSLGLADDQPLLIYVGRLDIEKRPDIVVEAFRSCPKASAPSSSCSARDRRRSSSRRSAIPRIITPGFVTDRADLARWLASADLYVSAMPNETFGVSVIEAQASGLPVVGVNGGAMPERVLPGMGLLGPSPTSAAMAANILAVLAATTGDGRARPRPCLGRI